MKPQYIVFLQYIYNTRQMAITLAPDRDIPAEQRQISQTTSTRGPPCHLRAYLATNLLHVVVLRIMTLEGVSARLITSNNTAYFLDVPLTL